MDYNGLEWILNRIEYLKSCPKRAHRENLLRYTVRDATHQSIWQGSYDVWECEQDRIDAINIPLLRMKEAEEGGFIQKETIQKGKYIIPIWTLTELGKEFLEHVKLQKTVCI